MKKNYNIPSVEVLHVAAMTALCESQFGSFKKPEETSTIDPSQGL
jgi:hypothetical protein